MFVYTVQSAAVVYGKSITLDDDATEAVSREEDVGMLWHPGRPQLLQRPGEQLRQLQRVRVVTEESLRDGHPQRAGGCVLDRQTVKEWHRTSQLSQYHRAGRRRQ